MRRDRARPRGRGGSEPVAASLPPPGARVRELARVFLKLGTIGFGGPAAHIALMEREVVRDRAWLSRQEFLDLLAATNLIPGPNSTEMAIHVGYRRGGWPGLIVAGTCFILPAASLTLLAAWAYVRYGAVPQLGHVLYGIKPVVIAIVLQALWTLGRTGVRSRGLAVVAVVALAATIAGMHELLVLPIAGVLGTISNGRPRPASPGAVASTPGLLAIAAPAGPAASAGALGFGLGPLFVFFLKTGAVLFGSGYVLLAFLRADLVERWHWLTESQLLDAVAVGQITPGPVFTTATFVGYVLGGTPGASVATLGIFLPAFVFVAISGPLVPWLRRSATAAGFLDGLNVGALALMAVVTAHLGRAAIVGGVTIALAAASAIALLRFRVPSLWLIASGALAGVLLGPRI